MAGYSSTPLARKLGIKDGYRVKTSNAPDDYLALLHPLPDDVTVSPRIRNNIDLWHVFVTAKSDLIGILQKARHEIPDDGMIWVSWPKKASKVVTDMSEDEVRNVALPMGLVDVKVCAINAVWSGLKLVIRKELRT